MFTKAKVQVHIVGQEEVTTETTVMVHEEIFTEIMEITIVIEIGKMMQTQEMVIGNNAPS